MHTIVKLFCLHSLWKLGGGGWGGLLIIIYCINVKKSEFIQDDDIFHELETLFTVMTLGFWPSTHRTSCIRMIIYQPINRIPGMRERYKDVIKSHTWIENDKTTVKRKKTNTILTYWTWKNEKELPGVNAGAPER